MQDELLALQKTMHKTLIFITHDFLEALKLGNRIAIMKDGAFVQVGTPEEVVAHPVNEYVRRFTQDAPKTRLLTARTLMRPGSEAEGPSVSVHAGTTLAGFLPLMLDGHTHLSVVDEQGTPLGTIDREAVMRAIGEGAR
jgi:glycine betaine/proline transport system ATP-binding protein